MSTFPSYFRYLFLLLVVVLFLPSEGMAQYAETIRSGRPGQSIGPFTTGARVLQVQAGVDYGQYAFRKQFFGKTDGRVIGSDVVVRMGITERFEMGIGVAYRNDLARTRSFAGESETLDQGVSAFSVRLRSNVYEGKGIIPSVGFQFNLGLPAVSKDFRPKQVAPKITVMTAQNLGKRFGLTTNWGAVWDGNSEIPEAFYIINIGFVITDFVSIFAEQYANMGKGYWNGSVDGGFAFLINPDLQLDVLGGYGPFNVQDDWFVSTGVSWRIRFNKREKTE